MDIYEKITNEDLTDDLKLLADYCGIGTVRILLRELGGIQLYIPKLTRLDNFITRYMKENNDKSFKMLAMELRVSEQFIRKFYEKTRGS